MRTFVITYLLEYNDAPPTTVEAVRALADSAEDDLSDCIWSGPLRLDGEGRVRFHAVEEVATPTDEAVQRALDGGGSAAEQLGRVLGILDGDDPGACRCAAIMAEDAGRHFQGCPLQRLRGVTVRFGEVTLGMPSLPCTVCGVPIPSPDGHPRRCAGVCEVPRG